LSLISVKNLTFSYDGNSDYLFSGISFDIDTDWKLGLIGRNGKGKTTLLKILKGDYECSGKITSNVSFSYFPFKVKEPNRKTVDIIKKIAKDAYDWEIEKEINLLKAKKDILNRSFESLSGGEQVKALLVGLFLRENNFLLLDEPTSHLDLETRENLIDYLKKKKGFIVVSHERDLLNKVVDHIISINNTGIEIQKGNFESFKENRDFKENFLKEKNEKLEKAIKDLKKASKKTRNFAEKSEKQKSKKHNKNEGMIDKGFLGHKSAKIMKKSKVLEKRIDKAISEKTGLLKSIDTQETLKLSPLENRKGALILVNDLKIIYENKGIFSPVSFEIKDKQRVLIKGKNGTGKSSLLKLIAGENVPFEGNIDILNGLKISYVPQNTKFLKGSIENYIEAEKIDSTLFKTVLSKMGFSRTEFLRGLEDLSEGQKKKILLTKSFCEKANVYIWDEPLNYLDILTREQIEEAILNFEPTIIFVEHDSTFSEKIANKIVSLEK